MTRPIDVDPPAGLDRLDRAVERLPGPLHQQPRLLVDVAAQVGGVGVAVHAADERGDVEVHDVAVLARSCPGCRGR
jgi:hypothetical protein